VIEGGAGTNLHHDHDRHLTSHAFQDEVKTLWINSNPNFVHQLGAKGCVKRVLCTLQGQLRWLRRIRTMV
jgi:hypothetical protein